MIRIFAVSISAAALIAASLPANAQSFQRGQQQFRNQGPSSFSGQRFSQQRFQGERNFRSFNPPSPGGQGGQRNFRSFNPPAPGGQTGQVQQRSFNPPAPAGQTTQRIQGLNPPAPGGGVGTSQRSFGPQAPTGGQNFVGGPGRVPASLPAPSLGQSTPTDAPGTPAPQQTATAPAQPADAPQAAPQGDLQAPIPETVTGQVQPTSAEQMPADAMPTEEAPTAAAPTEAMPAAEGGQPAPKTAVSEGGEMPTVVQGRRVVKVAPGHVVRRHVYAPHYVEYYQPRRVYVPTYHVYRPHHGYHGHRFHGHRFHGHHGHRGYGHRRW